MPVVRWYHQYVREENKELQIHKQFENNETLPISVGVRSNGIIIAQLK